MAFAPRNDMMDCFVVFASPQGAVIVRLDRMIQHAAAFRFIASVSGILHHPLSRVMQLRAMAGAVEIGHDR
jgi:hypothetical protein